MQEQRDRAEDLAAFKSACVDNEALLDVFAENINRLTLRSARIITLRVIGEPSESGSSQVSIFLGIRFISTKV